MQTIYSNRKISDTNKKNQKPDLKSLMHLICKEVLSKSDPMIQLYNKKMNFSDEITKKKTKIHDTVT